MLIIFVPGAIIAALILFRTARTVALFVFGAAVVDIALIATGHHW
jgi:hypothetical protein